MLRGETITGCDTCYKQEEDGRTSNRQHSIMEWNWRIGEDQLRDIFKHAEANDGHLDMPPVYLDLRLGNLCNLKCRMCNPWNSSQIVREHKDSLVNNPEYIRVWEKTFGKFPEKVMDEQVWFDGDVLWDQVISLIPVLKKVYMTGGEPTLIKNNFKFMEECIKQGRTDIALFFNTNCTNINRQFLGLISQFDEVSINASMDGIGIVNDYIRAPSKWEQISTNIERLAELPNVKLGVTPTIQVYNVYNIVAMIKWVEHIRTKYERDIFIDFLINQHPLHLNTNILPQHIKDEVIAEVVDFKDNHMANHHPMTINSLTGLIGHLKTPTPPNHQEQLERFKVYTRALDTERGQSLIDVDARLTGLL
jgi:sulfatase maturation enzyme AslB (radical SAM superfamily)